MDESIRSVLEQDQIIVWTPDVSSSWGPGNPMSREVVSVEVGRLCKIDPLRGGD